MKLNQKMAAVLALIGLGYALAPSAQAIPQAYANASATITLMNGASQSNGIETALPGNGMYYDHTGIAVVATPTYVGGLAVNTATMNTLTIGPGTQEEPTNTATFTAAAAQALNTYTLANDLQAEVSIIRAGAGVDGLE
jgi:hypothetical protein